MLDCRWIGGLGMLCTHSVVQARLILKGKDYGPHLVRTFPIFSNSKGLTRAR